ncbi:hypothetical protein [Bacillus sp. AFS073361]|nr:hypothetical protein [Bacillus sp. AFS073361]
MAKKVLAAVAVGQKETALHEFDIPDISAEEGILRIEIVGICGTDVSYY